MAICPVILISAKILNSKYPYLQIFPENNRLKNQSKLKGVISHPDGNSPPSDNWWQHILMDSMYIFFLLPQRTTEKTSIQEWAKAFNYYYSLQG